ncbi:MAG: acylphosphatase [Candidatus Peribacteraceae bacterium]|nr:acylphosphatase [Candidatus Peribacteraceae bacterium]
MAARLFRVFGRVQGVFFRSETEERARELGVTGWVRNCDDGSVEVHAEGTEEQLSQLEEWLHTGPAAAKVAEVRTHDAEPAGFRGFTIQSISDGSRE